MSVAQGPTAAVSTPPAGADVSNTVRRVEDPAVMRRVNVVGRLMLWSVTILLALMTITALASLLWLLLAWLRPGAFTLAFRLILAVTAAWTAWTFVVMFVIYDHLVPPRSFMDQPLRGAKVHVGLTSYNDREAVIQTVKEFKSCPEVTKVCVADNNSKDGSFQAAQQPGADSVVLETIPGYGSCCMAAMAEAEKGLGDDDVIVLCEGDMTFSAGDVRKMLAYLEHCDLVLGTRTTQELRETDTQMDWLINPGNQIMAKLTQARFWEVRLSDVGCTYRAIRAGAYRRLQGRLTERGMMLDYQMALAAMTMRMRVIEIPIVFRRRVGESKGVGSNKIKALKATFELLGMLFRA